MSGSFGGWISGEDAERVLTPAPPSWLHGTLALTSVKYARMTFNSLLLAASTTNRSFRLRVDDFPSPLTKQWIEEPSQGRSVRDWLRHSCGESQPLVTDAYLMQSGGAEGF